ncbi:phospholipase D-like domain-containing protein [Catellatospora sp. KI3]|uniref:phospholipase D-like domain-containing protein n=1 Tax=Catellatospora sp. KI3 TaxID=3041620 RepID=UPI0024822F8E|nr:phospholipase D-like domain-containing protein [Catellatospora sp. KI3]MDI1465237.1 phospholipase D-like domain-containing protein [Catellatospora sp. KI3]
MTPDSWFLSADERGNPATAIDRRRGDGLAWTRGNLARPLVHGAAYFHELVEVLNGTRAGDVVMFTDWRGDPDERLDGPRTQVTKVLGDAARRGVLVYGLLWRSHPDWLHFSSPQNRQLAEELQAAGAHVLLDMRVRFGGSHHQKMFVVRHPGRPERDVAFVGGIDLCRGRNDDAEHRGDPLAPPMAEVYGPNPPWHDIQLALRGPAVGDIEHVFRERWTDPSPLSLNLVDRLRDRLSRLRTEVPVLPGQLPDPPACGPHSVQTLRTYPRRRLGRYPFAPRGERSIARGYLKSLARARQLIYVEDQYLWSARVIRPFAQALRSNPELRLICVVPLAPDAASPTISMAESWGRKQAMKVLGRAGGDRVAVYGLENAAGTPIYVHAKSCVVDDAWATVGSDNFNLRSWTYDSELTCAVVDESADPEYARDLRLELMSEHLSGDAAGPDARLRDPKTAFDLFAAAAKELDDWHEAGATGPRPRTRLRRYVPPKVRGWRRLPARLIYELICDPDGRPGALRLRNRF